MTVYENYYKDENLSVVWNKLVNESRAEYVCLLNNDTVPNGNWLELLLEEMKDGVGAVGPISNSAGGHQGGFSNSLKEKTVKECNMLSCFCVLIDKKAFQAIGGFDERFKLYGEDSDLFHRMRKAGYKLITNYNSFVYHHGKASTKVAEARGKDITKIQRESAQLYQEKIHAKD